VHALSSYPLGRLWNYESNADDLLGQLLVFCLLAVDADAG